MHADPEYLSDYYRSLSDEALLEVDRADLTDLALTYYDGELMARGIAKRRSAPAWDEPEPVIRDEPDPSWSACATEVYSVLVRTDHWDEQRAADARQILDAARIPCHLELVELTDEEKRPITATHRWRLTVPEKFGMRAMSELERCLSNADFEQAWRAQLESCPQKDLPSLRPDIVFCGLFDRVERVTRAYDEEVARRRR